MKGLTTLILLLFVLTLSLLFNRLQGPVSNLRPKPPIPIAAYQQDCKARHPEPFRHHLPK